MSPDAGAYRYLAGRAGIVTPDDPLPVVEQALRDYDIRWLVLERDHVTPALAPVLAGAERPELAVRAGAGRPGQLGSRGADPASADPTAKPPLPRAALYAVCLAPPEDPRCAP